MNPTLSGAFAVLTWSMLAALTAASGHMPPFQLLAVTMAVGGLAGILTWPFRGVAPNLFRLPARVWLVGIAGLFGYHFFYYTALRNAPPAPAGLIAYLWPTLIVAGSALLPGERLRWHHLAGVALGFSGAAFLLAGGAEWSAGATAPLGYASALACALVWSAYSIVSRTFRAVPTDAVALYCLASAALATACHMLFEDTLWPAAPEQWLAILALGLLPVGLAFYAWDHGVKHGNIQFLGSIAYFAPLFSTLILIGAGFAEPTGRLGIACILIVAGAVTASGRLAGLGSLVRRERP